MVIALSAIAAVLRCIGLNSDLWLDEIGTLVTYVRLPLHEIVRTYVSMNQHLLYSVLARIAVQAFGESPWALRLPAVLFGIAAIPALYFMARMLTSETESLLACALLTFSYHHIWFSQDARGYSAMVFWCLLGTGFLFRAMDRAGLRYWVCYVVAMTLGVVSLQNTFFVVLGQFACFLILNRQRRQLRAMTVSTIAVAALSLLCHGFLLGQMFHFMRTAERSGLGWDRIGEFLPVVTNGLVLGFGLAGLIAVSLLGAAGLYSYWQQTRLVAGILLFPLALNLALLIAVHVGAYPRSFLYELPFALLIAVRGAAQLSKWLRLGPAAVPIACAVLLVAAAFPLLRYYRYPKQDFTGALRYARGHKSVQDRLVAVDLAGVCYQKYYAPDMAVPKSVAELEQMRGASGTVWVLYSISQRVSDSRA